MIEVGVAPTRRNSRISPASTGSIGSMRVPRHSPPGVATARQASASCCRGLAIVGHRSHASPVASASPSACPAFETCAQLSQASPSPSPSGSAWLGFGRRKAVVAEVSHAVEVDVGLARVRADGAVVDVTANRVGIDVVGRIDRAGVAGLAPTVTVEVELLAGDRETGQEAEGNETERQRAPVLGMRRSQQEAPPVRTPVTAGRPDRTPRCRGTARRDGHRREDRTGAGVHRVERGVALHVQRSGESNATPVTKVEQAHSPTTVARPVARSIVTRSSVEPDQP